MNDRAAAGFGGDWFTTFGTMSLAVNGAGIAGTYRYGNTEGRIAGEAAGATLKFRYSEPNEQGDSVTPESPYRAAGFRFFPARQ